MHKIHEQTGGSVHFNKCSISELGQVVSGMREQVEYAGSRYVIVDYLQLANVPGTEHLTERITKVSNEIRRTAKELKIVSVGVSQYNRETSKDRENPPIVQGLMGGSALENDSDQVLLLDHTSYKKDDLQHSANATLILAKNRHGPQAKIPLMFNYRDLSITETVPVVMPDRAERYEKSEVDDSDGGDMSFDPPILAIL
jgi:replicative DNA helicase